MGASVLPLVLACFVQPVASADSPADRSSYDAFDAVTANPESPPGTEVPYTGSTEFSYPTSAGALDTSAFSVEDGEHNVGATNHNGCVGDGGTVAFAGRTAWLRFNPDVDGQLLVRAITPGYDSVLIRARDHRPTLGSGRPLPPDEHRLRRFAGRPGQRGGWCLHRRHSLSSSPRRLYLLVQIGGLCPSTTDPTSCTDPSVPGGATRIELRFVPDDSDGDGVPDSLDDCLDQGGQVAEQALVAKTWDGRFAVRLRLNDGTQGSGLRILRLGGRTFRCAPVSSPTCRSYRFSRQFGRAVKCFKSVDYAGNTAGTQSLQRVLCPKDGQLPVYPYPQYRGSVPYGCFRVGQEITRKAKRKFDFPSVNLRTSRVRPGVLRVRKG